MRHLARARRGFEDMFGGTVAGGLYLAGVLALETLRLLRPGPLGPWAALAWVALGFWCVLGSRP